MRINTQLNNFAISQTKEPCGYKFSIKVNLATSTIHDATKALVKKGLVCIITNEKTKSKTYHLQDPMMQYLLQQYTT